MTREAGPARV
jgi:hypothetical protein